MDHDRQESTDSDSTAQSHTGFEHNNPVSFLEYYCGLADPTPLFASGATTVTPFGGDKPPTITGKRFLGGLVVFPKYMVFLDNGNTPDWGFAGFDFAPDLSESAAFDSFFSEKSNVPVLIGLAKAAKIPVADLPDRMTAPQSFFATFDTIKIVETKQGSLFSPSKLIISIGEAKLSFAADRGNELLKCLERIKTTGR